MMHIIIPKQIRVRRKKELKKFNELVVLFDKHGFGISEFSDNGVKIYRKSELSIDRSIPITSIYDLSSKNFMLILDLIQKIDRAQIDKNRYLKLLTA